MDIDGNFVWAKHVGGPISGQQAYAIAVDPTGNSYITGYFEGATDFDPGTGSSFLYSSGGNDIFVLNLNANGDYVWAGSMGGPDYEYGRSIAIDDYRNLYITGYQLEHLPKDLSPEFL